MCIMGYYCFQKSSAQQKFLTKEMNRGGINNVELNESDYNYKQTGF